MPQKLYQLTAQEQNSSHGGGGITSCKVTSVILDDTHKLFNELGGWNSIGVITFNFLDVNSDNIPIDNKNVRDNIALPLNPNVKSYPLINELVYTIELPTIPKNGDTENKVWYYFTSINILNSPHQNAYIVNNTNSVNFNLAGVPYRDSRTKPNVIKLGKQFKDNTSVKPLLSFEGDYIVEGRHGQSIRLGGAATKYKTQWHSEDQASYVILSGRTGSTSDNIHTIENINTDDYIIAGFSNHQLDLDLPSLNFDSYNITTTNSDSSPETLYEIQSFNVNESTSTPDVIDNSIPKTEIYKSETSIETEEVGFINSNVGEFDEPEYVYVLDETTVTERSNVYSESPDNIIYNINVIPVKYLTLRQFTSICNNNSVVAAKYLNAVNQTLTLYKINTNKRIAHFLSQCIIESGRFTILKEIGTVDYFSKYERAGNALGNTNKGDGYLYRGRGIIQITGKYNYNKLFSDLRLSNANPDSLLSLPLAVVSAGWYWNMRSLNRLADVDSFGDIRRKVQGSEFDKISEIKKEYLKVINILGQNNATTKII